MKMRRAKGISTSVRNAAGIWRVLLALTVLSAGTAYLGPATATAELQFEEVGAFLSEGLDPDWGPRLATDGLGNYMVAFVGILGQNEDILFSVSVDDGETWSDPAPLNNNAAGDTGRDLRPDLVYGQGTWIAAWESNDDLSGFGMDLGNDSDILFSRSFDNGITWSDPAPLHDTAATDSSKITDGQVHLAANSLGVCIAKWRRTGTGPAGNLGTKLARSYDDGATWTQLPNEVSDSVPSETFAYGQGQWIGAGMTEDTEGNCYISMSSSPDGLTWIPLPLVQTDDIFASLYMSKALAADDMGNWVLVYRGYLVSLDTHGVKTSCSHDNGLTWTEPTVGLSPIPEQGRGSNADVATDGHGNYVAVWRVSNGFWGTLGDDLDILYSESADNGETWSVPAPVNDDAYTDTVDDDLPQVAWGDGSWVVTWEDSLGVVHVARAAAAPPEPVPGITAEPATGLYTTEVGGTATFSVNLDTVPADVVTVTLSSSNPNEGTVLTTSLTFDASNWDIPQPATVEGVDDDVRDGHQTYYVTLSAASPPIEPDHPGDPDYNGLVRTLTVSNWDDESQLLVDSIAYKVVRSGKDLQITITIVDGTLTPFAGASVTARLNGPQWLSINGVTGTDGTVVSTLRNAKSGTYTTDVKSVVADGFTWDGVTPENSFTK